MRIIDRYILREVALHFVAVTGVLSIILVSFRIAKVLDLAAQNQFPRDVVWTLVGLTSITELTILMPIGFFLAIMLALGRLYHDSEMAALQACGVGVRRLYRPILMLAAVVALVLSWLAFVVVPDVFGRAKEIQANAVREARLANLAPQHFGSFSGVVYYAESIDENGLLYNVFVQRRIGDKVEVTVAKRAEQRGAGDLEQSFVLYDGEQYEGVPGTGRFRISRFSELGYPIRLAAPEAWARRVESKSSIELLASSVPAERAELQRRLANPLMALILAVFAVPLARLRPRQGRYSRMGIALLGYFVYQIGLSTAAVWIEKQSVLAPAGLWWVHASALAFGIWLALKQDPVKNKVAMAGAPA